MKLTLISVFLFQRAPPRSRLVPDLQILVELEWIDLYFFFSGAGVLVS